MALDISDLVTCIVIVNWNGKALLDKCLRSLFQNIPNGTIKVVVVDNASTDSSVDMVQKRYPQVELIENTINEGFSKASNRGIRYALQKGAKYVMLLNNDIEITENKWLAKFTGIIESDPKIGVVGCKLLFPDGTIQHAGGLVQLSGPYNRGENQKDLGQYDRIEPVDYVTGAALIIKSEVIQKIGLLDEGFSPLYYEDTDWCVRAKLYGYNVVYTPKPKLIHDCGASSNKLGGERKNFYAKRSFIRFVLLNYQKKDIIKRTMLYESREAIRCLIVKSKKGPLPIVLRVDTAWRLLLFWLAWQENLRKFKSIIYLRRKRFACGDKIGV